MHDNVEIETRKGRTLFITNIEKLESRRNTRFQNGKVKSFTDKLDFRCELNAVTTEQAELLKEIMNEPVLRTVTIRGERFYMPKNSDDIFFWFDETKKKLSITIKENKEPEVKTNEEVVNTAKAKAEA